MNSISMTQTKFWIIIGATAFLAGSCGAVAGASGSNSADADPEPAVTATVTKTAKPGPTVTVTKRAKAKPVPTVTVTMTARTAAADDDEASGPADVSYENCAEVRAAGAAPIHRGEPGYSSDLDRDDDGVACDT